MSWSNGRVDLGSDVRSLMLPATRKQGFFLLRSKTRGAVRGGMDPRGVGTAAPASQRFLEPVDDGFQDLHPREFLVVAGDERPWRKLRAAARHHVIHRGGVIVPLFAASPVFRGDLVLLVG